MVALVKIVDQQVGKDRSPAFELRLASERVTASELIARRVAEDVKLANAERERSEAEHNRLRSFLFPFDQNSAEAVLNNRTPKRHRAHKVFSVEEEAERAAKAFKSNGFLMFINEEQIEALDTEITLTPNSEVLFLRLIPLIGG